MKHYNHEIGSKMTIAPGNVEYVYRAVVSMIDNGYKNINLNCVYEKGWELHHAATLYWQLKKLADYLLENDLWREIYLSIFICIRALKTTRKIEIIVVELAKC